MSILIRPNCRRLQLLPELWETCHVYATLLVSPATEKLANDVVEDVPDLVAVDGLKPIELLGKTWRREGNALFFDAMDVTWEAPELTAEQRAQEVAGCLVWLDLQGEFVPLHVCSSGPPARIGSATRLSVNWNHEGILNMPAVGRCIACGHHDGALAPPPDAADAKWTAIGALRVQFVGIAACWEDGRRLTDRELQGLSWEVTRSGLFRIGTPEPEEIGLGGVHEDTPRRPGAGD